MLKCWQDRRTDGQP